MTFMLCHATVNPQEMPRQWFPMIHFSHTPILALLLYISVSRNTTEYFFGKGRTQMLTVSSGCHRGDYQDRACSSESEWTYGWREHFGPGLRLSADDCWRYSSEWPTHFADRKGKRWNQVFILLQKVLIGACVPRSSTAVAKLAVFSCCSMSVRVACI